MIRIHRPDTVPPSLSAGNPHLEAAKKRAHEHFSVQTTSQERFDFDASIWHAPDVMEALDGMFHGKCAYCETTLIERERPGVDHYRPTANTKEPVHGKSYRDRYYWLAYEWTNLFVACRTCARNRANEFAVRGNVSEPGTKDPELASELPLLLNPCIDNPEEHLLFRNDGQVITPWGFRSPRGEFTIQTLGLGRSDLVAVRREVAEDTFRRFWDFASPGDSPMEFVHLFREVLAGRRPYLAVRRTVLTRSALRRGWAEQDVTTVLQAAKYSSDWVPALWERLNAERMYDPTATGSSRRPRRKASASETAPAAAPQPLPPPAPSPPVVESATRGAYIEEIEIRNFRAIRELVLKVPTVAPEDLEPEPSEGSTKPPRQPWLVLLGENGTGKSSVLQAVAYALMGEDRLRTILDTPDKIGRILRRPPRRVPAAPNAPAAPREGAPRNGMVRVKLSTHTIQFSFDARDITWDEGKEGAGVFLRGYGSTRLLPSSRSAAPATATPPPLVRVDNLFDPFEPLNDAESWFTGLGRGAARGRNAAAPTAATARARQKFDAAALALKDLLPQAGARQVEHDKKLGTVLLDQENVAVPLHELSDGYQTVIALAADIMAGVPGEESDFATRAGIVLLDELGTHLHPRWRMEIVKGLRSAFPSLQFIATTHEPLCLRGLGKGEVVVMMREAGVMRTITGLPSTRGLRVDQLLTSRFFGLHTTIEPRLDQEFQEYYDLLSRGEAVSAAERARRSQLKDLLQPHRVLGYTRRDQLVAEALDDYFAQERQVKDPPPADPEKEAQALLQATRDKIIEIWKRVSVVPEVVP